MRGLERIAADRRHLVAQQVRCSTGFTWGRRVADGAAAVVTRPPQVVAVPAVPARSQAEARGEAAARARDLHRLLLRWPAGDYLPPATEIARLLGCSQGTHGNQAVERVARAFLALEIDGVLVSVAGSRERFRGERMVRLREGGRLLRTEGAPAFWEQLLKEMAP